MMSRTYAGKSREPKIKAFIAGSGSKNSNRGASAWQYEVFRTIRNKKTGALRPRFKNSNVYNPTN